jgi:hypothetical protein
MNEKEPTTHKQESEPRELAVKKQQGRYSTEKNKKVTAKLNETQTGPRRERGKKQRRQFKLAPNRG